ncbi:MAG: peptidyl-prolyl cis-trans isomerase [Acidobacteriota bacterium]|nr:MAG: peptidyl-prolyl cis-trans isomerase [Acidobacteriota bacterium]
MASARFRSTALFFVLALGMGAATLACQGSREDPVFYRMLFSSSPEEGEVVAEIGDFRLHAEHFLMLYNNLPEAMRRAMTPGEFLDAYVNQKVLTFDAVEQGFHRDPELRARLELAWNDIMGTGYFSIRQKLEITEEEMRRYYEENREVFQRPERVRVRHILVTPEPEENLFNVLRDDAVGDEEARRKIERLRARLEAGEDFAQLARQYSEDRSASQNGDLGFIQRGQTVPAFESAAFSLKTPGETSGVVKSRLGYHLLRLLDREETGSLSYAEAKPQILAALEPPRDPATQGKFIEETLESLKARYGVRVYEDRLPPT